MDTTILLIGAGAVTLLSLLLKFFKLSKENISIFQDIKEKNDIIMEKISREHWSEELLGSSLKKFRLAVSDWFTAVAILTVSYLLLHYYLTIDYLTRTSVFEIGLMFALLLFNILFLSVSIIERRIGYWIDEFTTIVNHILKNMESGEKKAASKKGRIAGSRPRPKKKGRR